MHLYKAKCIFNIDHCMEYRNGVDCIKCENGYMLVANNLC